MLLNKEEGPPPPDEREKSVTYQELQQALAVFGLGERATLEQLRQRHRELARRCHPDHGGADDDSIRRVNAAYQLLSDYCRSYRFSFAPEEFYEQYPEERLRRQFSWDRVWGGQEGEE